MNDNQKQKSQQRSGPPSPIPYQINLEMEKSSGEALVELMDHLDKQRLETFNKDIIKCYSPSMLPEYPPKLREFVTHNRVEEIKDAIEYLQNHRILFISGMGGVGKTTLARGLIETRPANVPLPFWFDFSMQMNATLGDVLEKLAGYMNTPDIAKFKVERRDAGQDDINRLIVELEKESVWVVFDNLETVLDGRYFHDTGLDLLFTSLRFSTHKAKIIVTSRTLPILKNGESLIDVVEEETQELKGLKLDFAIDYLKKNGLEEVERETLEKLTIGVDGHPLALKILVALVNKFGIKDTLNDLSIFQKRKEDTIKRARRLFEKLAGDEKELLERVSIFRKPESLDAIKSMFTDETSDDVIGKLLDKSLLESDHRGAYWLHPLVRDFSYNDLKDKIEVHKRAYEYYLSLPLPETYTKKEDVHTLIEAHHHACMAKEYDKAVDIISNYKLYENLDRWGNYITLIELYASVLPKNHFRDKPLLNDFNTHGVVLGNLGNAYYSLGQVDKAIEYYGQALVIDREIGDQRGVGADLGNLGNAYRTLGQVHKAIEYYGQSLVIYREIGDRGGEGNQLGNLGLAYSALGQVEKAIEYYEQALAIAREIGDRRGEGAYLGNLGLAYSALGQVDKAIEYSEQTLVIQREIGDRRGEGNQLGNLGLAYGALGQMDKAIEYYEQALVIQREIGDRRGEGNQLGNLGSAKSALGQMDKAIEYYEQALVIQREIGDRRGEGNQLGNLGIAYYSLGEVDKAIRYYERALGITREIEDRRGEGIWFNNLGFAFINENKYTEALACYLLAKDIYTEIKDHNIKTTESNLIVLKDKLGEKEFEILLAEIALGAEEIRMKILEGTLK